MVVKIYKEYLYMHEQSFMFTQNVIGNNSFTSSTLKT